jgi:Diguanylate cyclase, GGDEF domain
MALRAAARPRPANKANQDPVAVTNGGSGRRPGQREGRGAVPQPAEKLSIEQEELRGISRTVAEIEWLLLILVLLYQAFGGPAAEDRPAIAAGLFFYTRPVSLLMVDTDNLQSINDDCGHEVGNRLLQLLAMCIMTELRRTGRKRPPAFQATRRSFSHQTS